MSDLRLPRPVLDSSFRQLRDCGAGRAECVVYWCASLDQPDLLTRAVHPVHRAGPPATRSTRRGSRSSSSTCAAPARRSGYRFTLTPARPVIPGSTTGSRWRPRPAFLSLVIPCFASGPTGFTGTALVQMQPDGVWAPADPGDVFRLE